MCGGICVSMYNGVCEGERTTFSRLFSLSTMWVLGIEFIASDLAGTLPTEAFHQPLIMTPVFYGPMLLPSAELTNFMKLVSTVATNATLHIYTSVCTCVKVLYFSILFFFKTWSRADQWIISCLPGAMSLKKTCSPSPSICHLGVAFQQLVKLCELFAYPWWNGVLLLSCTGLMQAPFLSPWPASPHAHPPFSKYTL